MTARCFQGALLSAFLVALAASPARASQRYTIDLGGGRFVVVDNASQMSKDWVQNLVIAADRSTATDCPYDQTPAGLLRTSDRVCVTDNYIAWFDQSVNNNFARSGELAGLWTLNPETNYPRYFRTNTCSNWAHNELLPGSASPFGQVWFWDTQSPPVEHVVMASAPACFFGAVHYAQLPGTNAAWTQVLDGASYTDGVHYKVSTRLADGSALCHAPNPTSTFGTAWIDSELEYICRPRDILSVWKFKPSTTITASNTFTYVWTAYSLDQDNTNCDELAGDNWPDTVYGQPLFARSNKPLTTNWTDPQVTYPANSIVPMDVGPVCPYRVHMPPLHFNRDIYSPAPAVGDTLEWGEASNLDASAAPRLTMKLLDSPPGTQRVQYDQIQFANETYDGVLGGGPKMNASRQYSPNTWYGDTFSLQTTGADAGSAHGDFNHDGKSDILLQDSNTKALVIWYMDGNRREGTGVPSPGQPVDPNWEIVSTADFNNDNKPDFLWRNGVTAKAVNWFMDNDVVRCAGGFVKPDQAQDPNWVIKGAGDFGQFFGQDGRPDIVWQNLTSHKIVVWTMKYSPLPPFAPNDGCPPPGMGNMGESDRYDGNFVTPDPAADQVVGAVDDFNLDGYADLVLENGAGQVQLWLMNGLARTSVLNLSFGGLGGDPNWRVVGAGYFNEDQAPDILWRNSATGQLKVWFMDRTNPVYTVDIVDENFNLAYAPAPLNVVGPR